MPDADDPRDRLARQVKRHLDGLQAAGVGFVPARPTPAVTAPPPTLTLRPTEPVALAAEPVPPSTPAPPVIAVPAAAVLFEEPQPVVPADGAGRRHALDLLSDRVGECPRCAELYSSRTNTVFGEGAIDPDVCFVGEAPGAEEDASGRPFVGKSGQLLSKIIAACGFKRDEVYICNVIKCRPPGNRTPSPAECANCREYLEEQLALVRPKYLVALGGTAANNLLGNKLELKYLRGKVHQFKGTPVVCTFHPAAMLRNEAWKKDCWEDMKMLLKHMGRPVPGAKA